MPWKTFETRLTRSPLPGGTSEGQIIDIALARQVYRILYTSGLFMRFQLLLEGGNFQDSVAVANSLPTDAPLSMVMRGQILANTGKPKEAAALSTKIISDPHASARLAFQAVQFSGERPDRVEHMRAVFPRLDNRPDNRFFMASLLQKTWYGDMAEAFYTSGLRQHPLWFSAYRELSRVTGTMGPINTALDAYDHVAALHGFAGDFHADRVDPKEIEKALPFYQRARALAPREAEPVLNTRRVLYRLNRKSEVVTLLNEALGQGQATGSVALQLRGALANTYLDLKQLENALAAIDPVKSNGGPEIVLIMARIHEIKGDYKMAFAAYGDAARQFPKNRRILAAVAGFNWRAGRFRVAADTVAAGRDVGVTGCQWYLAPFASAFRDAPEPRLLSALTHLREAGADRSEIRCLAFGLEERRAFSAAFTLMNALLEEDHRQDMDLAVRMAVLLKAWKGEHAAGAFLEPMLKTPLPADQAQVLYRYGFFKPNPERLVDVSQYPREYREQIRLIYVSAWFASGRTAYGMDEHILRHYRGSWLQQKRAQVTGHISSDPSPLAGRYLLGMTSRAELFERIDSPRLRCQYQYIVGLSKRTIGRFSEAAAWYQLARESLQVNIAEFGWATSEMFWWAHLGNGNRNTRLDADIAAYFNSLSEVPEGSG